MRLEVVRGLHCPLFAVGTSHGLLSMGSHIERKPMLYADDSISKERCSLFRGNAAIVPNAVLIRKGGNEKISIFFRRAKMAVCPYI